MRLTSIKTLHTLVFVGVFGAILFLLYCGVTDRLSRWTALAFAIVMVEVAIYIGNGFRCPLRTLAEQLTPSGEAIVDIYLPPWLARRVVKISTPLLLVACLLLLWRLLT